MTFRKFPRNLRDTWNFHSTLLKHTETAQLCDAQACGGHTVTIKGQVREDSQSTGGERRKGKDFEALVTLWKH